MIDLQGYPLCTAFQAPIREFISNNPGAYLEIGIYYAHFIAGFANDYPNVEMHAIDPFISDGCTRDAQGTIMYDIEEIARHNISQVNNIRLHKGTTEEFLARKEAKEILKTVSCILIDGSHHYEDIIHDIKLVLQIENDLEKAVFFDDITVPDVIQSIELLKRLLEERTTRVINHPHYVGIYFK